MFLITKHLKLHMAFPSGIDIMWKKQNSYSCTIGLKEGILIPLKLSEDKKVAITVDSTKYANSYDQKRVYVRPVHLEYQYLGRVAPHCPWHPISEVKYLTANTDILDNEANEITEFVLYPHYMTADDYIQTPSFHMSEALVKLGVAVLAEQALYIKNVSISNVDVCVTHTHRHIDKKLS